MYGTLAAWRSYATARGNSAPTDADDADATAALVRASDHIRLRYVAHLLKGYDTTLQPAGFDIPLVEESAYVAATLELATPGFFSKTYTPAQQKVLTGADKIRWTVIGDGKSMKLGQSPVSTVIEAMFEPYIRDVNGPFLSLKAIG